MSSTFPKDDENFEEVGIEKVSVEETGWSITRSDGWSFFISKDHGVEPKVGMSARFYGKGIGFTVRGVFLDGVEVFYRTEAEDEAKHRRETYGETFAEMLAKWDGGKNIWSIEMGGLGPGYEQAIQVAAIEIAREGMDVPLEGPKDGHAAIWKEVCDRALAKHNETIGGLSGAQFGAASWLSWKWVHGGGPAQLMDEMKSRGENDRAIQVSKHFPHAVIA